MMMMMSYFVTKKMSWFVKHILSQAEHTHWLQTVFFVTIYHKRICLLIFERFCLLAKKWFRFFYVVDSTTAICKAKMFVYQNNALIGTLVAKLNKICRDTAITKNTKFRLLNSLVFPIAIYEAEVWTLQKNNTKWIF